MVHWVRTATPTSPECTTEGSRELPILQRAHTRMALAVFSRVRAVWLAIFLVACEGQIAAPQPLASDEAPPGELHIGWPSFAPVVSFQLRRLTRDQYVSSVTSLLQLSAAGMPPIEPVTAVAGFSAIGASTAVV